MSFEKYSTRGFDDRIVAAIERLVEVKKTAAILVSMAADDRGEYEEEEYVNLVMGIANTFERELTHLTNDIQAVNNAAVTLTKNITGTNTEEDYEVDVLITENGVQF
jgi:hypothetical protein